MREQNIVKQFEWYDDNLETSVIISIAGDVVDYNCNEAIKGYRTHHYGVKYEIIVYWSESALYS